MGSKSIVFGLYGALIVSAALVCFNYGRWAVRLHRDKAAPRFRFSLVLGISLSFFAIFMESLYWATVRLSISGYFGEPSSWEYLLNYLPAIAFLRLALITAAIIHLHAYWLARHGGSFWKSWVTAAVVSWALVTYFFW